MQLVDSIDNEGWEQHNLPDGRRHDETLLRSINSIDSELGRLYFHSFISPKSGIRHILSKHSDSFKHGMTVITGYDSKEHDAFKLTGAFTPEEHRGNRYCRHLLTSIVRWYSKVVGDSQNTPDGQALMHYVGVNGNFNYKPAVVIDKEEYLARLASGISDVEIGFLKQKAFHIAVIEVR